MKFRCFVLYTGIYRNHLLARGRKLKDVFYNALTVEETLRKLQNRWKLPKGVIFHCDRGSQYTAKNVMNQISGYGWQQSFSRVGMPGDNSWSESFFANLKKEIIHWKFYPTREQARQTIFEYIEIFYNRQRVQKRLGYYSPIHCLNQWYYANSRKVS